LRRWDLLHDNLAIAQNMEYRHDRLGPEIADAEAARAALEWAANIRRPVSGVR
jgi:hypothetical protein